MNKKLITAFLAAALLFTQLPAALAASVPSREDAAQALAALDIMVGDQSGNLNLGAPVTRAEFAKLVVAATPGDQGIEMRLRQAYSQTLTIPALDGVRMAVVDSGADAETLRICQCFCEEKGLPLLPAGKMEVLVQKEG